MNEELIFTFEELPAIRFKDTSDDSFIFYVSNFPNINSYTITQEYLKSNIFVPGLEECNIIIEEMASSFTNHTIANNEMNIVFDYDLTYTCNIEFKANLENYDLTLNTVIRVILPYLEAPVITNERNYYNLITTGEIITFSNVFKNQTEVDHLTIRIYDIGDTDYFSYSNNSIYYSNMGPITLDYTELSVSASNIFGSNTHTLKFIKQDFDTLAITGVEPTSEIIVDTVVTCNISPGFEIIYSNLNITNITKSNSNLIITNGNRGIYYDAIIKDYNYNYVYRIRETGDTSKPILVNSLNYYNLITPTREYSNIFKNGLDYDSSEITIYHTNYPDAFTIEGNVLKQSNTDSLFIYSNVVDVEVKASNLYQSNIATIRFFKIDYDNLLISNLTSPTSNIVFENTHQTSNIVVGESFNIIYPVDITPFSVNDNTLTFSNSYKLSNYDILVELDNEHIYIYRIQDSSRAGLAPILKETSLYYYLVAEEPYVYSNVFSISDSILDDSNITIFDIGNESFTYQDNTITITNIDTLFIDTSVAEITVKASNSDGDVEETLRFLKLGYNTLTVPNLTDDKVSNIYMLDDAATIELRSNFTIAYNPIEGGCNLEISGSNLIVKDDYRGIYDTIVNLGNYIVNIFRINERADNTNDNTYSL